MKNKFYKWKERNLPQYDLHCCVKFLTFSIASSYKLLMLGYILYIVPHWLLVRVTVLGFSGI
jgi:hypothetical protein